MTCISCKMNDPTLKLKCMIDSWDGNDLNQQTSYMIDFIAQNLVNTLDVYTIEHGLSHKKKEQLFELLDDKTIQLLENIQEQGKIKGWKVFFDIWWDENYVKQGSVLKVKKD